MLRNSFLVTLLLLASLVRLTPVAASGGRTPESDKQSLTALEDEWLNARDAATLDRILAPDFVHPVSAGLFLTKAQNIDWLMKHLRPATRKEHLDHMQVRIYGEVGIVNGILITTTENGKELDRLLFTDVFEYRDGRWQAVNAQETRVGAASN